MEPWFSPAQGQYYKLLIWFPGCLHGTPFPQNNPEIIFYFIYFFQKSYFKEKKTGFKKLATNFN